MQSRPPPSNFDRITLFESACPTTTTRTYMNERQFIEYVAKRIPDAMREHSVLAHDVIRRCYASISVFDLDRPQAFEDARAFAISEIDGRLSRFRTLARARQSAAPAHRNAPMASMTDRRGGADDVTEDDRLD